MPETQERVSHTKGPWEVREDFYIGRPGKVHSLAEVKCGDVPADAIEEHKANARLISSAPDLLEACKSALAGFDEADFYDKGYCDVCESSAPRDESRTITGPIAHKSDCFVGKLIAAIARATGAKA